jgi:mRNA-degrading endonuclease RelE of RelBE toxin-antitoxin system
MDRFQKFLRKLDAKRRAKVRPILPALVRGVWEGLDIKPMKGRKGWYRCRIGDIRIIFVRGAAGENILVDIDFRGNVYQKR